MSLCQFNMCRKVSKDEIAIKVERMTKWMAEEEARVAKEKANV
jgi:hypothetical protein